MAYQARAQDVAVAAHVRVSPDLQRLTVRAERVPRGRVLSQISARLGVEIRAYDVNLETPVTVSVVDAPVDVVVTRVLPANARYVIRYGDRDVAAKVSSAGAKKGATPARQRGPTKGVTRPYVRSERSVMKKASRAPLAVDQRQTRAAYKSDTVQSLTIPSGAGPKRPLPAVQGDSSVRLTITITSAGQARIVGAQRVLGERTASEVVRGTLVYVLRGSGGNVLHFGTLLDPLQEHSYLPGDVRHDQRRAAEGTINVPIPARYSSNAQLASASLELFDARDAGLPQRLDQEALTRVLRTARAYAGLTLEQAIQFLSR
jgi:hypothetical protein